MNRICSVVVATSVAVLLVSLLAAWLWPQHPAALPQPDPGNPENVAHVAETGPSDIPAEPQQPTLAPPRPEEAPPIGRPERGVVYTTIEAEVNPPPSR